MTPFRVLRVGGPLALVLSMVALVHAAPAPRTGFTPRDTRLEDVIAAPGTTAPRMLHADLWQGLDQRVKLDTLVFVLENGARTCKVLDRDSTWAVDYTWIYPHTVLPARWYDPRSLIRTGDSLRIADDADLVCTFGTLRTAVRARTLAQATAAAYRAWPTEMPLALRGRLKLKLERALKTLRGEKDTEPTFPPR